jgi:parvulin-like peptidyl-prolyl isomerase
MHIRLSLIMVLVIALLAGCGTLVPPPQPVAEIPAPTTPSPQIDTPTADAQATAIPIPDTPVPTEPETSDSEATLEPTAPPQDTIAAEATPISPQTEQGLDPSNIASVNGTPITRAAYELRVTQAQIYLFQQPGLDATTAAGREEIEKLRERVLGWMVDQVLIEQAAAAGIGSNAPIQITAEQVEQQVNAMRGNDVDRFNKWLASNGLTLDQLRDQIRSDMITSEVRDQITAEVERVVPHVHVRHILISEESVAEKALAELRRGGDFVAVARRYSEDMATRNSGGDLGFVPHGVMPVPFEEVAFSLQAGQISDIIHTESGLHIIQVIEIDPAREVTPELWPMIQQSAFERWLQTRRTAADLSVADITHP